MASRTGLTQGWTYDANGNRLSQTGTAPSSYTMAASSNRLNGVTGAVVRSYSYDAAGNAGRRHQMMWNTRVFAALSPAGDRLALISQVPALA